MERVISVISKIREVKNANDLKPSAPLQFMLKDLDGNVVKADPAFAAIVSKMAKAEWLDELDGDLSVETVRNGSIYIPSSELSDPAEELKKLTAEKERLEGEIKRSTGILSNEGFLKKAPEAKVQNEKDKLEAYQKQYEVILARMSSLER